MNELERTITLPRASAGALRGPPWVSLDCSCSLLTTTGTEEQTACPRCGRRWRVVVTPVQDGAAAPTDALAEVLAASPSPPSRARRTTVGDGNTASPPKGDG